jgi:cell division protein FtsB
MKIFLLVITVLIGLLQYRLWYGNGGIKEIKAYQQELVELNKQVIEKKERNDALYAEVEDRARYELGMMKEGETFFQVLE